MVHVYLFLPCKYQRRMYYKQEKIEITVFYLRYVFFSMLRNFGHERLTISVTSVFFAD